MRSLQPELDRRRAAGLYRTRRVAEGPSGPERVVDGRPLINFCSNDYLGLAGHPDLAAALARGACEYGAGAGSAHLVGGHSRAHHALEEELAEFTGRPRALLFSTGYMANLGVISALAGRSDTVYQDRLNHASLLDGAALARARLRRYPHNDAAALGRMLGEHSSGEALVATDGVFSMDGDLAPLRSLAEICRPDRFSKPVRSDPPQGARKGAWLMVDDAHGIGVLGAHGGGTLEHFGLGMEEVPILMGTLGKALGSFGAFVAGSEELIETLIQQARSYIFTTATPPAIAEATRAALRLVREEPWRRERLRELIQRFRQGAQELGMPLGDSITPIQPIIAGSATRALEWSRYLEQAGFLVPAIRPPTVPEGSARLRVTLSAAHTNEQLERLLEALAGLLLEEKDDN